MDCKDERSCWIWKAQLDKDGYGRFYTGGKYHRAHRFAFKLTKGDLPPVVMHMCDTPACCNPAHLAPGTQPENMRDKVAKGRQARGSRNGMAKLTEAMVVEIRRRVAAGEAKGSLAREYGLHRATVSDIHRRKIWRHVPE